jgi:prepilin-type processing-associated H-X9-DG protein
LAGLDWDLDVRTNPPGSGILWLGTGGLRILQCPTFQRESTFDPGYCGYNYNTSYIGGGVGELTPLGHSHQTPARLDAIHRAPQIALFGDGQRGDSSDKFMRAPIQMVGTDIGDAWTDALRVAGTQGYRHLGRTNVCYCDGHAASVSERFITPGAQTGGTIVFSTTTSAADGTGFLSADNSAYDGGR